MNGKVLAVLAVVLAAVAVGAWVANKGGGGASKDAAPAGGYGDLILNSSDVLANAARIEIREAEKTFVLSREKGKEWGIPEKSDYPAKPDRVTGLLASLSGMKLVESATAKPDWYKRIGVDEPGKEGSTGKLITLKDAKGATLASVIIGNPGQVGAPSGGARQSGHYVRRAGEGQSYLGSGSVQVDTNFQSWIDNPVLQLDRNRVKSVTITRAEPASDTPELSNVLEIFRDAETDKDFKLRSAPPGREMQSPYVLEQTGGALAYVSIDDAKPISQIDFETSDEAPPPQPGANQSLFVRSTAKFVTFDGMVLTVRVTRKDSKFWLSFAAAYDAAEVVNPPEKPKDTTPGAAEPPKRKTPEEIKKDTEKEIADINAKLSPWAFGVSEWAAKPLHAKLIDMLKKPEATPPVGPQPVGPPTQPGEGPGNILQDPNAPR